MPDSGSATLVPELAVLVMLARRYAQSFSEEVGWTEASKETVSLFLKIRLKLHRF